MEISKLQPPEPHSGHPPNLRRTRSWSPAPRLQKSRPDVGWVCSCYRFLCIKKKKSHVQVKMTRAIFPPLLQSPHGYSSQLWCRKGQPTFLTSWGSSSHPTMAWSRALPALRKGNSMSAPTQRCGSHFQRKRQEGAASQEKEKTLCCR